MDINNEQFVVLLRSALHYLYDPDQLRRNPLANLLDVSNRVDASFALQKILINGIEGICPDENEPAQSRGWLLHDVLYFRYVRGYERQAVANQLGISDRQLSREQRAAIETLAQYLWKTYQLENRHLSLPGAGSALVPGPMGHGAAPGLPAFKGDIGDTPWVADLPAERPSPWKLIILSVLDLLQPLIHQHAVQLVYAPAEELPNLLVPQNTLRHALLNILNLMTPLARHSTLALMPVVDDAILTISVVIQSEDGDTPAMLEPLSLQPNTEVAKQLLERANGSLNVFEVPGRVEVRLSIPAMAQIPVLVTDDNADTIQLFQRYVQGTRYSVIGAQGPAEFYHLLDETHPRIILMDVMMPDLDGWDLLFQLRQERQIRNTAIIVCSILPQETLARSLGADGFLQKPVLPQDFLQALDEQMRHLSDGLIDGT